MDVAAIERIIATLGFPTALLILIGFFIYKTAFPWVTKQFENWQDVYQKQVVINQQMLDSLVSMNEQIRSQPNRQIVEALARISEKHDAHHTDVRAGFSELRQKLDQVEKSVLHQNSGR